MNRENSPPPPPERYFTILWTETTKTSSYNCRSVVCISSQSLGLQGSKRSKEKELEVFVHSFAGMCLHNCSKWGGLLRHRFVTTSVNLGGGGGGSEIVPWPGFYSDNCQTSFNHPRVILNKPCIFEPFRPNHLGEELVNKPIFTKFVLMSPG